jgi:methylglyoxal synthase
MNTFIVALIAHDAKKEDLLQLVKSHKEELFNITLIATRSTGQLVRARTEFPVTLLQSGPLGGDQQIGALVAKGKLMPLSSYVTLLPPILTNRMSRPCSEFVMHMVFL